MPVAEGFAGQRLVVLPRPAVAAALRRPPTSRLLVTDVGRFPTARDHGRHRPDGSTQAIVIVCVAGSGWAEVHGRTHPVGAGQVVLIGPGVPHSYGASPSHPWTIWWLHVAGQDVADLVSATGASPASPVLQAGDVNRCSSLVDEALRRLQRDDTPSSLVGASGAAWHLLCLLAADRGVAHESDRISAVLEHLADDVAAPVRVPELAASAGMSTSHFSAVFRRRTGGGVVQYQLRLRMNRARGLLDTTDLPVHEVARLVGFQDPFYFSRQFHRVHGLSPRQYRAQVKG